MSVYKELGGCFYAMSLPALGQALGELGYERPTLFVTANNVGIGHEMANRLNLNLEVFEPEVGKYTAWYIEWNGKRIGSEGA